MPLPSPAALQPRKSPRQMRSAVTVEAIHTAAIQVLLAEGLARLTTTRVAARAGVSVGTMYQYFPNKQALLFAVLEQHIEAIIAAMERAVAALHGQGLVAVAEGLAHAWLDAKTADIDTSRALYAVAAEFDIGEIMSAGGARLEQAIADLLAAVPDHRFADSGSACFMLMAVLGGSVRAVLEGEVTGEAMVRLRRELPRVCRAYLIEVAMPRGAVMAADPAAAAAAVAEAKG